MTKHLFNDYLPIPKMPECLGRVWCTIINTSPHERRIVKYLLRKHIPHYLPRIRLVTDEQLEQGQRYGKMLFPGYIFAAVHELAELEAIQDIAPAHQIRYPWYQWEQQELIGELRFMKLAELLNVEYQFRWIQKLPETTNPLVLHDENGCGYVQVTRNAINGIELCFQFKSVQKLIAFSMSEAQFRALCDTPKFD